MYYMKSTLLLACRNLVFSTWEPPAEQAQLISGYREVLYLACLTALTEHPHHRQNQAERFLVPPVPTLELVVADLQSNPQDAILITPRWKNTTWFSRA